MSYAPNNYTDLETLSAVQGLQQSMQQRDSGGNFGLQARTTANGNTSNININITNSNNSNNSNINNPLLRIIPGRPLGSCQQGSLVPTANIAPIGAINGNVDHYGNAATTSAGSLQFQQSVDGYQYMDETTGHIVYQSRDSMQQNPAGFLQETSYYGNATDQSGYTRHLTTSPANFGTFQNCAGAEQFNSSAYRAPPASLKWLLENVEEAEGVSLPRYILYGHYLRHCNQTRQEPMNQASFGKLVRSVFTRIKGRRLGARGKSKYHYQGIRIKSASKLNGCSNKIKENYDDFKNCDATGANYDVNVRERQETLGDGDSGISDLQDYFKDILVSMPMFGKIELEQGEMLLPEGVTHGHLKAYEELYAEHCEAIVTSIMSLQFDDVELLWRSFWRNGSRSLYELEKVLPVKVLYALSEMTSVQKYTTKSDHVFYQLLVNILIPNILKPIPSTLTCMIRNFSRNIESALRGSMTDVCFKMVESKVSAAKGFAQILRRYTSLNHLVQAARVVLQNPAQVSRMLADINKVDFDTIQEQGSWICGCSSEVVKDLEADMKRNLEKQLSLVEWMAWLEGVVGRLLGPVERHRNFAVLANKFFLNWSFYCLMVIRDLTLRSAASFGSFHLIHLLFDEYMFYLIERKVAEVRGETPIAVVSRKKDSYKGFDDSVCTFQVESMAPDSDFNDVDEFLNLQEVAVKQENSAGRSKGAEEMECCTASSEPAAPTGGGPSVAGVGAAVSTVKTGNKFPILKISSLRKADANKRAVVIVPSTESRKFIAKLRPDAVPQK